ncbi:type II restriction enzyme [Actinoplanes lutulentus]|uniref:Type II restriction enzyme n=1 Tax=Actinoplanes lutulentus TaxID=1287878 RepID=A0A327Z4K2_9ACTN|nr:BsuBI/PstI family type II restriction endonuclease [Actinoplanes lutulentus]MBB2943279.1 type II restriction enzyme [Actinoplanes lutulentus]RAK28339.1 type II restriction enzyme [Actinoplanes lutulentus]
MSDPEDLRIEEARGILARLGFDRERANERSALVLLALLGMTRESPWSSATSPLVGTRAIMDWIRDQYGRNYAPNTRETIRRFTLHQFADALLVEQNPDNPSRPVNSPKWCYRIHPRALELLQHVGESDFQDLLVEYLDEVPGLRSMYAAARELRRIPVTLPGGGAVSLSPGGQNVLIKSMVEEFCEYFTPGGEVLYIGDADAKWAVLVRESLAALGVTLDQHGKMPDLVIYLRERNWLVLLEAASSHGPVDAKRHRELAKLFEGSTAGLVYVSCFPDRREMRKYLADIAWETEVWCAENPTHLIHFNGERFLGPYGKT